MWPKKIQSVKLKQQSPLWSALGLTAAILSGCGSQAFDATSTSKAQSSPGSYQIPAKVDIVLAQSDMGSMYETYTQLQSQFPSFLAALQSSGWDYHFTVVPLTTSAQPIQVVGSQYDANWGSSWISPYPGASEGNPGSNGNLQSSLFSTPARFNGFNWAAGFTSNANNGNEQGIAGIVTNLTNMVNSSGTTQILRPDALLVVIAVSTEDDSSGLTYTTNQNGVTILTPGETESTGLSNYQSDFANLVIQKSGSSIKNSSAALSGVQFYAAVAYEQNYTQSCIGSNSSVGTRYVDFANMMGGTGYDICSNQISGVITGLTASLQNERMAMETDYLFISQAPNVATITVTKYPGGSTSSPQVIPQDATNGWTYVGYQTEYAIDAPVPMNQTTGYAIELHGTAKLEGDDTANVNYTPAGLQNSSG